MSLDKAIQHRKEHREPYRGAKAIAGSCRNGGDCSWCQRNREHKLQAAEVTKREQLSEREGRT